MGLSDYVLAALAAEARAAADKPTETSTDSFPSTPEQRTVDSGAPSSSSVSFALGVGAVGSVRQLQDPSLRDTSQLASATATVLDATDLFLRTSGLAKPPAALGFLSTMATSSAVYDKSDSVRGFAWSMSKEVATGEALKAIGEGVASWGARARMGSIGGGLLGAGVVVAGTVALEYKSEIGKLIGDIVGAVTKPAFDAALQGYADLDRNIRQLYGY